jgi:GNAT superfamily N-acetyltransferase
MIRPGSDRGERVTAEFEVRREESPPLDVVLRLYKSAGWWEGEDRDEVLEDIVRGAACFAAAYAGGEMIGMGRVLSDGVSDAYIQDLVVDPAWRKRGVGSAIVVFLRNWCVGRGFGWIGLVAMPGTVPFYEHLGFEPLPGHVPMRLPRNGKHG